MAKRECMLKAPKYIQVLLHWSADRIETFWIQQREVPAKVAITLIENGITVTFTVFSIHLRNDPIKCNSSTVHRLINSGLATTAVAHASHDRAPNADAHA